MKKTLQYCFLYLTLTNLPYLVFAQQTIYDQNRVNSIFIYLHPDSLEYLLSNPEANEYLKADFIYSSGQLSDTVKDVGFRLRGNTSRYSQKKSFKVSFNEFVPGRSYQDVKKLNLNGQHNDPSMIREKLFYDLWNSCGMPERRSSFVKVFINDRYFGVYTNIEEFDKKWLQRVFPENDGNLYKCTYPADLVYIGEDQQSYKDIWSSTVTGGRAYALQTNETEDNYEGFVKLISTLNIQDNTEFKLKINEILNVQATLKAFALDVVAGHWDNYMFNKNNYFLYQSKSTGIFEYITYDTDNTFGVDWVDRDWATRDCMDWVKHGEARPLANRLLSIPEYLADYAAYLDTITRIQCNETFIFPHIDSLINLIADAALADTIRSKDYGYTYDDFINSTTQTIDSHTPYGIKPFISARNTNTAAQLRNFLGNDDESKTTALKIFPNPFHEQLFFFSHSRITIDKAELIMLNGQKIILTSEPILPGEFVFDTDKVPSGFYLLSICTNEGMITKKVIKH